MDIEGVTSTAIQKSTSTRWLFTDLSNNESSPPTCLKEKEDNEHLFNAGSIDNDDEHNMKK